MADPQALLGPNPFTLLSLIGGPAVLTNASSLLVLSTSNRFARAIDRARSLAVHLQAEHAASNPLSPLRMRQLHRAERRSLMLLAALRMYYLSLGSFAMASLVSLLGAGAAGSSNQLALTACIYTSLAAGSVGVGSLVLGCVQLVRETRLAAFSITEEAALLRERHAELYVGNLPNEPV
jgi:hypothetical protein